MIEAEVLIRDYVDVYNAKKQKNQGQQNTCGNCSICLQMSAVEICKHTRYVSSYEAKHVHLALAGSLTKKALNPKPCPMQPRLSG